MKKIFSFLIPLIIFLSLIFFHFHGLTLHDNGYIVHAAQQLLEGKIIYRDFDFVYTPLSAFIAAAGFKILGQSIFVERIIIFIFSLLAVFSIHKIIYILTKKNLLSFIGIFIYIFWGPGHVNYLSPVMLSINLGIITMYFLIKGLSEKTNNIFLAGIISTFVLLSKQNFGLAIISTVVVYFVFLKKNLKIKYAIDFIFGYVLILLIYFIYLISNGSLTFFTESFYIYTFKMIFLEGVLNTPFIYNGLSLYNFFKTTFYFIPAIISVSSIIVAFKKNRRYVFLGFFVLAYYFFGIRPETDYVHLSPIISITGIALALLWKSAKHIYKNWFLTLGIILILIGLYTGLFKGFYRWEQPLIENKFFISHPSIRIWSDQKYNSLIPYLDGFVKKFTKDNDYIYIDGYVPLIYFITQRKDPLGPLYEFQTPGMLDKEIINKLINKNVKLIISDTTYRKSKTLLDVFMRDNFKQIAGIREFVILYRRDLVK